MLTLEAGLEFSYSRSLITEQPTNSQVGWKTAYGVKTVRGVHLARTTRSVWPPRPSARPKLAALLFVAFAPRFWSLLLTVLLQSHYVGPGLELITGSSRPSFARARHWYLPALSLDLLGPLTAPNPALRQSSGRLNTRGESWL